MEGMMAEHSPAPWTAEPEYEGQQATFVHHNLQCIAECDHGLPASEQEANARLIAAAPEMLAVLQAIIHPDNEAIVYFVPSDAWAQKLLSDAKVAVAKATGIL
jgi:hypothetical protein